MAQQAPSSLIIELRGILCIVLIVAVFFLSTIFKAPVNPGAPISQTVSYTHLTLPTILLV